MVEAAHDAFVPLNASVTAALTTVQLAGTSVDSWHRVWFELHEDLVATLGISR